MGDGGDDEPKTMHAAMRRVVWSEHVVDRRRSSVFERRGWPRAAVDREFLVEECDDYLRNYEAWLHWAGQNDDVPVALFGSWQLLTRGVVVTYAHAQSGDVEEERQIELFIERQPKGVQNAWLDLMLSCVRRVPTPRAQPR